MKSAACALAILLAVGTASGRTLTNQKAGTTLEVPGGWSESPEMAKAVPPTTDLVAGLAADAGGRTFTALSTPIKPSESAGFTKGLLGSLSKQGFNLSTSRAVTINGVNFDSYTGTRADAPAPILQVFSGFANDRAYAISLYSQQGDPSQDPELQGLVQSFRFVLPPKPFPTVSPAYKIGYQAGQNLGMFAAGAFGVVVMLACPAALIVGAYFLLRKKK